jgi:hypothetical protein
MSLPLHGTLGCRHTQDPQQEHNPHASALMCSDTDEVQCCSACGHAFIYALIYVTGPQLPHQTLM